MAQFRLDDLPECSVFPNSLLSFHYCEECTLAGDMPFGGHHFQTPDGPFGSCGYDVRVLGNVNELPADGLGEARESPLPAHSAVLETAEEVPSVSDWTPEVEALAPDDYPLIEDDLDEDVYPGLVHVARSKVGGWPSWVQDGNWPVGNDGEKLLFVAQLDWELGENASWGGGGYAYLFVVPNGREPRGEMIIQTT